MSPKIKAWWCTNDPKNTGWYAEEQDEQGNYVSDSVKVWSPVNLDSFTQEQEAEVTAALCEAYPHHEIYVEDQQSLKMLRKES